MDFPGRLLQDGNDPCTDPDCPGVSLKVRAKQDKKGGRIRMLIKVANNAARTASINDGLLAVELPPTGVRYLDSASWPKGQGRVQSNSTLVTISDISLSSKKDIKFKLLLSVHGNAGDNLVFAVYFHDYDKQCTDTERVEVRLSLK